MVIYLIHFALAIFNVIILSPPTKEASLFSMGKVEICILSKRAYYLKKKNEEKFHV